MRTFAKPTRDRFASISTVGPLAWALAAQAVLILGCRTVEDDARKSAATARTYDVGVIAQGGALRLILPLENHEDAELAVASWTTSCECLTVQPERLTVEPNSTGYIAAKLNFANEAEFRGDLRIELEGLDTQGRRCISKLITLSVVDPKMLPEMVP
ncbi:MAG: DUF1573 domain-containing protein [Pirellulales bacterium]